jgi:glycosyltransferase involved in cell wall biosynthesis
MTFFLMTCVIENTTNGRKKKRSQGMDTNRVAFVEPYYGGSHRTLIDALLPLCSPKSQLFSMRAKKWHWRMRSSALTLSQQIPDASNFDSLFVSSMVNLSDLLALRKDLAGLPSIVLYFHENQLEYPKQSNEEETRDHYFGHANITSALVAHSVLFNSNFNRDSFLRRIPAFLNALPMEASCRPNPILICQSIYSKSAVVFMPVTIPPELPLSFRETTNHTFRIGFPHRWEHDKDPAFFLRVLVRLQEKKIRFSLCVFGGEEFDNNSIVQDVIQALGTSTCLEHCGRVESRSDYLLKLQTCDVVVSTALHEFFGVSMVEASLLGCFVLCPDRLAYPELFRPEALYRTESQLVKKLITLGRNPQRPAAGGGGQDLFPAAKQEISLGPHVSFSRFFAPPPPPPPPPRQRIQGGMMMMMMMMWMGAMVYYFLHQLE